MHAEMFASCSSNWSILWIFQRHSLAPRQCHPWQIHPRSWIARWRSYLPLLVQLHSFVAIEDRCRSPKGQQCFTCNSATRKPCFWRCKMVGDRVLGLFNTALRQGFTSVSYDMESALKFATQSNQGRQGNLRARFFSHGPIWSIFPRKETWRDVVFATTGQPNDHCWFSRSGKLFSALKIGMTWTLQYPSSSTSYWDGKTMTGVLQRSQHCQAQRTKRRSGSAFSEGYLLWGRGASSVSLNKTDINCEVLNFSPSFSLCSRFWATPSFRDSSLKKCQVLTADVGCCHCCWRSPKLLWTCRRQCKWKRCSREVERWGLWYWYAQDRCQAP